MVGQIVGKYRVLDRIGRGGMGTVYRAHDEMLDRDVAIKVLNPEVNDPEVARRFRAEAVTVARLNDPGIATIYELLQHDEQWLMVMEFVRGETLERLVQRAGALAPERAADLCTQALTALGHAHRMGVVHRDLKPANLMMTESGAIKIMDFGIARVSGTDHLTHAGYMMGTPAYMAPEQVLGHDVDGRADLYAMGVVLYRLVTGKLPFKGETPFAMAQSQLNDPPTPVHLTRGGAPAWVELVIARALAKAPVDRFQTADEFSQALQRAIAGLPMDVTATIPVAQDVSATTRAVAIATSTEQTRLQTAAVGTTQSSAGPGTVTLKKRNLAVVGTGAAVLVALAIGFVIYRTRTTSVVSPPAPAVASTPSPAPASGSTPSQQTAVSVPVTPAAPAPPPAPPPTGDAANVARRPTPGAVTTTPSGTTPVPPAISRGPDASATGTPVGPAAAPPSRGRAASADPHVAFVDVKMLVVEGRKASDQDVVLNLAAGQLSLVSKKGGTALRSLPYSAVMRATYSHSRDPQWDPAFSAPPPNIDLPGVLRSSRHWLTLQTGTDYVVLRLDDSNWANILDTVEARTGVAIQRVRASGK